MQYLSKAYSYYSGINPATLSGAIDVIVIRHVQPTGEVVLACSPFHVRFGKLQVLRAGEKRVTIELPNNLPPPHIAPFSMKVGEAGEAFFVLETTDEVPEELLTSPVVMATDANDAAHSHTEPPGTSPEIPAAAILTQEPFGDTEKQADCTPSKGQLGDVDFLDLDALGGDKTPKSGDEPADAKQSAASPSSILGQGGKKTSSRASIKKHLVNGEGEQSLPENPTESNDAESAQLFPRNHRLATLSHESRPEATTTTTSPDKLDKQADEKLPKVAPGIANGPDIAHIKNAVLDMAGYHRDMDTDSSDDHKLASRVNFRTNNRSGNLESTLVAFARDLMDALPLLGPTGETADRPSRDKFRTPSASRDPSPARSRFERVQSEPPPSMSDVTTDSAPRTPTRALTGTLYPSAGRGPLAGASPTTVMDYAWDWGRIPEQPSRPDDVDDFEGVDMERSASDGISKQIESKGHLPTSSLDLAGTDQPLSPPNLGHVDQNPYMFNLAGTSGASHTFELSLCGDDDYAPSGRATLAEEAAFLKARITFKQFEDDPNIVDDPRLVLRYGLTYLTWATGGDLLRALAVHRRAASSAASPLSKNVEEHTLPSFGWSRWWRKTQPAAAQASLTPEATAAHAIAEDVERSDRPEKVQKVQKVEKAEKAEKVDRVEPHRAESSPPGTGIFAESSQPKPEAVNKNTNDSPPFTASSTFTGADSSDKKHYAKTLRLSSDQLKQLELKPGPNTVRFSVTSSYSGVATCTARIFLWEDTDHVVISDIDGTITKSDALGHVFAAIGRDWTHPGIAKLYTDICNNGYKMLYLTSRAIGQADSTREYLKTIVQGNYRLPEGPVIMSPDRLMVSLHREVIMRKPELFKMACLRDIQRLFGEHANEAFYAGFGNRITDAMSYRSVGVPASMIYTIDSTGVVKTELLSAAGHKGSYVGLNDIVDEVFPPVEKKFKSEFNDFNYWRPDIGVYELPDLSPPSPALSARSDASSRYSVLGKIIGRASSLTALSTSPNSEPSSRPSSPLIRPALTPDELSEAENEDEDDDGGPSFGSSMPGSFESRRGEFIPRPNGKGKDAGDQSLDSLAHHRPRHDDRERRNRRGQDEDEQDEDDDEDGYREDDSFDDGAIFDDDILAAGEMKNVPF